MLHKVDDEFDDRNMFLQVTLGLISVCAQCDRLMGRYGFAAAPDANLVAATPAEDPVLNSLLGLVALSQRIMARLDTVRAAAPAPELAAASPLDGAPPLSLRSLLA